MVGSTEELRSLISSFLQERLDAKLEKLPDDDPKRIFSLSEQASL